MKNKETWKLIIQTVISILSAIATTLGLNSCLWAFEQWVVSNEWWAENVGTSACSVRRTSYVMWTLGRSTLRPYPLTAHYSKLKNLWSSVASASSVCQLLRNEYTNAKKHKNPPQWGGFCASKGLILPLKTPFLGLFGGTFTGFYKNIKSYVVEC